MSEATAPAAETSAAPTELGGTVEERAEAIFGPTPTDAAPTEGEPAAATSAPDPDAARAQRIAERRAKWEELQARQRSAVDAKAAQRRADDLERQLNEERARIANLVDPSKLDPIKLLELGQRAGHSPKAMAEALANAMGSPEAAAAFHAMQAVNPRVAELESKLAEANAKIESFLSQQQRMTQAQQVAQAQQQFMGYVAQNAATSPLTARFLEQHGAEDFLALAQGAAQALPDDADASAVLDEIEDRLSQLGRLYAPPSGAPQRQQATPPRSIAPAAAPTHVTNQLAQQRSRVVDEAAALEDMSLEERAAILFST